MRTYTYPYNKLHTVLITYILILSHTANNQPSQCSKPNSNTACDC